MLQLLFACFTQTIVDHTVHIAGAALIQILFGDFPITVVTANLQLIHTVRMFGEQSLKFVNQNPSRRLPDVLVHSRTYTANHPAVTVAATNLCTNLLCLRAVPQFIPSLIVQVAHDFLILGTIARHNIAIRIDEEGIEAHVTRQQALLAVDVVDQTVIKVSTEPLLRAVATEQFVDQILEVLCDHRTVMDDVLGLHEIERVVQGSRGKLHPHVVADFVERHQIGGVAVLHGHAEPYVLHTGLTKFFQGLQAALIAVREAADGVVGAFKPFDGDAYAYLRELLAEVEDAVGEEAVGGDHYAVALLVKFAHHLLEVGADERFAPGDVCEIHLRKFPYGLDRDFLVGLRWCLVAAAHRAAGVAPVCHDYRAVEFLF